MYSAGNAKVNTFPPQIIGVDLGEGFEEKGNTVFEVNFDGCSSTFFIGGTVPGSR